MTRRYFVPATNLFCAAVVCIPTHAMGHDATLDSVGGLTPFLQTTVASNEYFIPPDTYTRLVICIHANNEAFCNMDGSNADENEDGHAFTYKKRPALARLFAGKTYSSSLNIKVTAGDFVASVPIVSLEHDSSKTNGESFIRKIRYKSMNFPLILMRGLGAGSIATLETTLSFSDTLESYAASRALSAVVKATSLISSAPPLLTKLSVDSSKAVANSIDNAISSLFATSVTEQPIVDQRIDYWKNVHVKLKIPRREGHFSDKIPSFSPRRDDDTNLAEQDAITIGTWHIFWSQPRVSAFSMIELDTCNGPVACKQKIDALRPILIADVKSHLGEILNYPIIVNSDNPITLIRYLKSQD